MELHIFNSWNFCLPLRDSSIHDRNRDRQKLSLKQERPLIFSELIGAIAAGLSAALLMTSSEFPFWRKWGMAGVGEWQVDSVIYSRILLHRPKLIEENGFPWKTVGTHLLNGIIAGVAFRLLLPTFYLFVPDARISILYDAIVYSFVLWLIFPTLGRTTFETLGKLQISNRGLLASLISHFVYGIFLGLFLELLMGHGL